MLDWIVNPEGVSYGAYVVLWIALLVFLPVAVIIGALRTVWSMREKRDGLEPKRVQRRD